MQRKLSILFIASLLAFKVQADPVIAWNQHLDAWVAEARIGTPPAVRIGAIVQTAVWRALQELPTGASPDAAAAAVASANRQVLQSLLPTQQTAIESRYRAALDALADGPGRQQGVTAGERAARLVLAERQHDGAATPETYRPFTAPGLYVPTAPTAVPQWAQRKPWLMRAPAQFRPAAPPALDSAQWARDFDEVRRLGQRSSAERSGEQTEAARFWDYSLPSIYHQVLRSVAVQPGRSVQRNARWLAAATQAMDDALIATMDAKYHHSFWRPITAIRNADLDGQEATVREPGWTSLVDAPMHPEYPSAHSALAAAVATLIRAEVGSAPMPTLSTSSPAAKNAVRQWASPEALVAEVSNARIWGGIHFRSATRAGEALGAQVGALAAQAAQTP
jgi:PAP2 superfamily